jgi:hypothetical protein
MYTKTPHKLVFPLIPMKIPSCIKAGKSPSEVSSGGMEKIVRKFALYSLIVPVIYSKRQPVHGISPRYGTVGLRAIPRSLRAD